MIGGFYDLGMYNQVVKEVNFEYMKEGNKINDIEFCFFFMVFIWFQF